MLFIGIFVAFYYIFKSKRQKKALKKGNIELHLHDQHHGTTPIIPKPTQQMAYQQHLPGSRSEFTPPSGFIEADTSSTRPDRLPSSPNRTLYQPNSPNSPNSPNEYPLSAVGSSRYDDNSQASLNAPVAGRKPQTTHDPISPDLQSISEVHGEFLVVGQSHFEPSSDVPVTYHELPDSSNANRRDVYHAPHTSRAGPVPSWT